jgi:SAM-dependent methyltransferase
MMHDPEFDRLIAEAVAAPFCGWDFSRLEGRRVEEEDTETVWDYEERARKLVQSVASLLDLGTGGGERLSLLGPFPPLAVATEAYGPNVPIATRQLQPLGVQVVRTHPGVHDSSGPQPDGCFAERRLPFPDASFELVLAHSSAFFPAEVYRVLCPGGLLLTAQGAPSISPTMADVLEGPIPDWAKEGQGWDIDTPLDEAGFASVEKLDAYPKTTYLDIGAVVYVLRAVPWMITDFDVERYRERLYWLHLQIKREGRFTVRDHQRLLAMRKPADIQAILALKQICTTAQNMYDAPTVSDLRTLLAPVSPDPTSARPSWEDTQGTVERRLDRRAMTQRATAFWEEADGQLLANALFAFPGTSQLQPAASRRSASCVFARYTTAGNRSATRLRLAPRGP